MFRLAIKNDYGYKAFMSENTTNTKVIKGVSGLLMVAGIVCAMFTVVGWVMFFTGLFGFVAGRMME